MSKIFSTDIEMSGNDISGAGDVGTATVTTTGLIDGGGNITAVGNIIAGISYPSSSEVEIRCASTGYGYAELNFSTETTPTATRLLAFNEAYPSYLNQFTVCHRGAYRFYMDNAGHSQFGGLIADQLANTYTLQAKGTFNATTSISEGGTLLSDKYAQISHNQAWSTITSTPTTISGYGITDYNTLGDARWVQKSGDTMTGTLVLPAATTLLASLRFAPGTAPTSPVDGDMWGAGTSLYYRTATTTRQIVSTSTYSTMTQAEAEAGTATSIRWITAQRMRQGVVAYAAPISHTHVASNITDFNTAVDARISAGAYLPLAGGTMSGDITGANTKFKARNVANTLFTDFTQNGIISLADGCTQQAELGFFADGTGLKTNSHMIVNGTANMTWENSDTLLNKSLRLATGITIQNSAATGEILFGTVASPAQDAIDISNANGSVRIGMASATWAYYETDASKNYFNKPVEVYNDIQIENNAVTVTGLPAGYTNNTTLELGCDHRTTMRGSVSRSTNLAYGSGNPIYTISTTAARPPYTVVLLAPGDNGVYQVYITSAGVMYINQLLSGSAGATIYFDGITFPRA